MKLPSSGRKRYLGGADWCLATLNHGTRETTGRRAAFHVAVLLAGAPDADRMDSGFRTFCERFPVLWGALARCWCLAPYWKYPPSPDPTAISVTRSSLPAGASREEVVRWMEARANAREPLRGCAVSFHILRIGEAEGALGFSFDHHLFDAGGAERFIVCHATANLVSGKVLRAVGFVPDHEGSYESYDHTRTWPCQWYRLEAADVVRDNPVSF